MATSPFAFFLMHRLAARPKIFSGKTLLALAPPTSRIPFSQNLLRLAKFPLPRKQFSAEPIDILVPTVEKPQPPIPAEQPPNRDVGHPLRLRREDVSDENLRALIPKNSVLTVTGGRDIDPRTIKIKEQMPNTNDFRVFTFKNPRT